LVFFNVQLDSCHLESKFQWICFDQFLHCPNVVSMKNSVAYNKKRVYYNLACFLATFWNCPPSHRAESLMTDCALKANLSWSHLLSLNYQATSTLPASSLLHYPPDNKDEFCWWRLERGKGRLPKCHWMLCYCKLLIWHLELVKCSMLTRFYFCSPIGTKCSLARDRLNWDPLHTNTRFISLMSQTPSAMFGDHFFSASLLLMGQI